MVTIMVTKETMDNLYELEVSSYNKSPITGGEMALRVDLILKITKVVTTMHGDHAHQ